jgi:hypothetical protein
MPREGTDLRVFCVKCFVSHGCDYEDTIFLDVTPCSLADRIADGSDEDACGNERAFHPEEGGGRFLRAYQSTRCNVWEAYSIYKYFRLYHQFISPDTLTFFFVLISGMSSFILRLTLATKQQNSCQSKLCVRLWKKFTGNCSVLSCNVRNWKQQHQFCCVHSPVRQGRNR